MLLTDMKNLIRFLNIPEVEYLGRILYVFYSFLNRYQENIRYPSKILLNDKIDSTERIPPETVNQVP